MWLHILLCYTQVVNKRAWKDLTSQGWGKRTWNQLQGVWGKRSSQQEDETEDEGEEDNDSIIKRSASGWNKMQGVWGKRSARAEEDGEDGGEEDPDVMDKRSWNQLQGVWGKRSQQPVGYDRHLHFIALFKKTIDLND